MARTVNLASLRAQVRQRADIENDPHVSDPELNEYINQSWADLYSTIAEKDEDDYTREFSFNTAAGTRAYGMEIDFWRLVSVAVNFGSGRIVDIGRWSWAERAAYLNSSGWQGPNARLSYRLVGMDAEDQMEFLPTPDGVYAVTTWYIPAPPRMTTDSSFFDGKAGWEEWVVLDAAVKCKLKSEEDVRDLVMQREARLARITAQAATRDVNKPDRVQDVSGRNGGSRWDNWND